MMLEPLSGNVVDEGPWPPPLSFLIQGDTVQFRPTTWPPHWLSFDPGPVFLEQHCSSKCVSLQHALPLLHSLACRFCSMVDYDLMNWFFNCRWKPPWFSFRYYQAVPQKQGEAVAGFLIRGGFKLHQYNQCFFVIFLNLMDFKLAYSWIAMACFFSYSHGYGLGWRLSYLLRPSNIAHRSRFTEKAQWPFLTLALFSLLQKQLWPPQDSPASCAYIQVPKCMRVIFFVHQCIMLAAWDDPVLCTLCGDERLQRILLGYYTSQELGKIVDVVFCHLQEQCLGNIVLGQSFYMGIGTFALHGLVIKWPRGLVLTVIATDHLMTPWDPGAKHLLFFSSKPFGARQLYLEHNLNCLGAFLRVCTAHAIHETCVDLPSEQELIQFHWDPGSD